MIKMTLSQPEIKMKIAPAKVVYQGGGGIQAAQIDAILVMTKSEYDALDKKDARTLYLLEG